MANELRMTGFSELAAELARFPGAMRDDAAAILSAAAVQTAADVKAAYPVVSGDLRDGVTVRERAGRGVSAVYTVTSGSRHAHFYEFGTVRTRPHPTFVPMTARERRAATVEIADHVHAEGLDVGGARD